MGGVSVYPYRIFVVVNSARIFLSGRMRIMYNLGKKSSIKVTVADNDMQMQCVII